MDVLGGRDAERNKSQRDNYCMAPLTVESKKYNKLGNITKRNGTNQWLRAGEWGEGYIALEK